MAVRAERVSGVTLDTDVISTVYALTDLYKPFLEVAIIIFHAVIPVNADVVAPFPCTIRFVCDNLRCTDDTAANRTDTL
jgi:hypothetical protein